MTEANILGEGAQGIVYKGTWHGSPAAFKVSESKDDKDSTNPMAKVEEMQNKMKEVYDLIDLQKTIHNYPNESKSIKELELTKTIDLLNNKFKTDAITWGINITKKEWEMNRSLLSDASTTNIKKIPIIII